MFEVVEYDHCLLLLAEACEQLNFIRYCNNVSVQQNIPSSTTKIMNKYVFMCCVTKVKGEVNLEIINRVAPKQQTPRTVLMSLKSTLKELDSMVQQGIIVEEPGYPEWTCNITIVRKMTRSNSA
ncbi:hypothetical protein J6590_022275 [Homalodisca vitripennis]|nr:hypothetical protein J6590_022275 [Homalodisca vitripennis]